MGCNGDHYAFALISVVLELEQWLQQWKCSKARLFGLQRLGLTMGLGMSID